jgi:long-chain fatty acid transport protein
MKVTRLLFLSVLFAFVSVSAAFADGSGAFRIKMPDSEAGGKGFAFIGEADNPSAIVYNPAGLTQLKGAKLISLSVLPLELSSKYESDSGINARLKKDVCWIPNLYYVDDFGVKDFNFGFGFGSYWGLQTSWAKDSFAKYVNTTSTILTKSAMLAAAYKVNDQLSLGVGIDYLMAEIDNNKQLIQPGGSDGSLKLKGDDANIGYRLSALYKFNKENSLGFQYCSQIRLKFNGDLYMTDLNSAHFNYAAIFGGAAYSTRISAAMTLPQNAGIGYSFKPGDKWTINCDGGWIGWSSIKQQSIQFKDENNPLRLVILNNGNPSAMNWKDSYTFCLGGEYAFTEKMRLRAGYLYEEHAVPQSTWSPNVPDANVNGFTIGYGYVLNKNLKLDCFYGLLLYNQRNITNTVGASSGASINGKYDTKVNLGGLTLTYSL